MITLHVFWIELNLPSAGSWLGVGWNMFNPSSICRCFFGSQTKKKPSDGKAPVVPGDEPRQGFWWSALHVPRLWHSINCLRESQQCLWRFNTLFDWNLRPLLDNVDFDKSLWSISADYLVWECLGCFLRRKATTHLHWVQGVLWRKWNSS